MNRIWCEKCDAEMDTIYADGVFRCVGCNGIVYES